MFFNGSAVYANPRTSAFRPRRRFLVGLDETEKLLLDALKNLEACGAIKICARGGRNGTNQYDLHLLERKKAACRPEENGSAERKVPANKHTNKQGSRSANARSQPEPLRYELVTRSQDIDEWYHHIGTLNIGSPSGVLEATLTDEGYRLPCQVPTDGGGESKEFLSFFVRVLTSGGDCFV